MNVSYMMTKTFTYINFYRVNMNYLWNDIYTYSVQWYIPTMLSSSKQTISGHLLYALPHVPISTQIIATVTKNSIHNSQNDNY